MGIQRPQREAAESHHAQAIALQAQAEQGDAVYELGNAEPVEIADVPMTRHEKFLAANTHALLAVYFELRHQTGKMP